MAVANSFAIYGGNKCILVAARYVIVCFKGAWWS